MTCICLKAMRSSSQPRAHDFCRQLTANNTHTHLLVLTSQNRVDPFAKAPRQLGSLTKKKKKSFTVYRFPVCIGISSTPCQTCRNSPSIPPEQQKKEEVKNPSPPSVIFTSSSWKQHGTTILFRRTLPSIRRRSIEDRHSATGKKKKKKRNPIAV